jgi:peroxiredoxin
MKYSLVITWSLTGAIIMATAACSNVEEKEPAKEKELSIVSDNRYSLSGKIRGLDSGWVYLAYEDTSNGNLFGTVDSVKVDKEHFRKEGQISGPVKVILGITRNKRAFYSPTIFLDKGNLVFETHKDSLDNYVAKGNRSQNEYNIINKELQPLFAEGNAIFRAKRKAEKEGNQSAIDSLNNAFDIKMGRIAALVQEHVKADSSSLVSAYIIKKNLLFNPDPAILEPIYAAFSSDVKNSYYGKDIAKSIRAGNITGIGAKAPAFSIPDINGIKLAIETFKGKYTLVDFWASWCGPCRAENPNLLKAYNAFKNKGFTIVSVSLDDNKKHWLKAVEADKLPWTQLSDLKGSQSEVKQLYGIKSIPMNYLLDKDGIIIAKNLRGMELEKTLKAVFRSL